VTEMTNGKFSNEAAHCYADRQHGHVTTQGDAIIYAIERIVELEDDVKHHNLKRLESAARIEGLEKAFDIVSRATKEYSATIYELEKALKEARVNIEEWGGFVEPYFTEKYKLAEDLAAIDKVLGDNNV